MKGNERFPAGWLRLNGGETIAARRQPPLNRPMAELGTGAAAEFALFTDPVIKDAFINIGAELTEYKINSFERINDGLYAVNIKYVNGGSEP